MHTRYPRSSDLKFSTDPQNVLKFLKRSSKPSKSSEVHKRYSRRPQFLKTLSTSSKSCGRQSSSNGHQMVLTESSNVPKNSPQMFHKKSSKVPERFFNVLNPHVHRSSKSPQNVLKKSTKGIPRHQTPRSQRQNPVHKCSLNVLKKSKNHQKFQRFFNVLRASVPQVFKKSSKGPQSPQKVKKMHKRYPRSSDLRFSTDPQNVLKFLKRLSKPSKSS